MHWVNVYTYQSRAHQVHSGRNDEFTNVSVTLRSIRLWHFVSDIQTSKPCFKTKNNEDKIEELMVSTLLWP
jgi:hypothetical protein